MSSPESVPKNQKLDKLSFAKYMKNIGRAYRKQAMELVSICRIFVQAGGLNVHQDADLRTVLEVVDDALSSAAEVKNKTSEGTDNKFEEAINVLSVYEQRYHPKPPQQNFTDPQQDVSKCRPVAERMKSAKDNDKSSSGVLNKLKASFKAKLVEGPTKVARFLIPGSLTDSNPNVVEQVLGEETRVEEILWNFSRLKGNQRITLKQNPHFYTGLPRSAREYSDEFTSDPIEKFWGATEISVLTHERSRVFLETNNRKRAFGNFWVPDEAIIFKDIGGRLEGEGIVAADIRGTPNLWHREEHREPTVISPPVRRTTAGPAIPSDLPPINTNPVRGRTFEDWRQLIRGTLNSPNISVCISSKGTPPESPNDWVLSSPINPTPDSPAQPFSTIHARSTGASSGASVPPQLTPLRIPEPTPGLLTTYKTARATYSPVFRTALSVIPPPFPLPSTPSPRGPPPSPAKPTPISQDPRVAVLSSMSLTVTLTPPQARPPPSATPQRPEPPPQKATSTEAVVSSTTVTVGSRASTPSSTTLTPPTNNLARSSGLHDGDSQVGYPTSVPATGKAQAHGPGQKLAGNTATPVKDPAQTQGKTTGWFQKIRNYFRD